jgi:hypothetical protein
MLDKLSSYKFTHADNRSFNYDKLGKKNVYNNLNLTRERSNLDRSDILNKNYSTVNNSFIQAERELGRKLFSSNFDIGKKNLEISGSGSNLPPTKLTHYLINNKNKRSISSYSIKDGKY